MLGIPGTLMAIYYSPPLASHFEVITSSNSLQHTFSQNFCRENKLQSPLLEFVHRKYQSYHCLLPLSQLALLIRVACVVM